MINFDTIMPVMENKLNRNLEINLIKNTLKNFQHIKTRISSKDIIAFQQVVPIV